MEEKFFVAKVQYDLPDENSGKIKKIREEKLVKGYSVTDVEAKVTTKYEGFTHDWRITSSILLSETAVILHSCVNPSYFFVTLASTSVTE